MRPHGHEFDAGAGGGGGVQQARIPPQGRGDGATVREGDGEAFGVAVGGGGAGECGAGWRHDGIFTPSLHGEGAAEDFAPDALHGGDFVAAKFGDGVEAVHRLLANARRQAAPALDQRDDGALRLNFMAGAHLHEERLKNAIVRHP